MYANFHLDKEKLIEYLRSGNIEISDYLISNPFSKLDNQDFDGAMNESLFFESFFSLSYKKYETIAKILSVAESRRKNTVFITGYRGCGKTTLVNYVKRLITKEDQLPEIKFKDNSSSNDKNECLDIELHDIKELFAHFKVLYSIFRRKVPCDEIELDNDEQLMAKSKDVNFLIKQVNMYKNYINQNIHGKAICLDFEVGTSEYSNSIEQKLNSYLKERILEIVDKQTNKSIGEILGNIFTAFGLTTLEKKDSFYMKDFFAFIQDYFMMAVNSNAIRDNLTKVIKPLASDQLLSLIVLLEWSVLENRQSNERLYFIFDNLDTIHDPRILNRLMNDFVSFLSNTTTLLRGVDKKRVFKSSRSLHNDVCFIFIMRDTSQMNIVDHYYERLKDVSSHSDISYDVNKELIVNKKNKFIKEEIRPEQKNDAINYLISGSEDVKTLLKDIYVRENVSPMFNNDYKRMIICLANICEKNSQEVDEYIDMMYYHEDRLSCTVDTIMHEKQGARGILFRLIFNHFKSEGYFNLMGVRIEQTNQVHYTVARFVLLYLSKKQFEHNDEFMSNDDGRVPVSDLIHALKNIPPNTGTIPFDEIIDALRGMYTLRNADSWGHLITYDSNGPASNSDFQDKDWMSIIDKFDRNGNNNIINIRITCAGRSYVRFMASHFELYACRFCENSAPLFSSVNERFIERENKYGFEKVLEKVCRTVEQFCDNMDIFVKEYIKMHPDLACEENILKRNDFVYLDKNKRDEYYNLFHEERYIHQHISYIDSYRMYIINKEWGRDYVKALDINKRILKIIERYIRLLNKHEYYSPVSKNLYKELSACYDYIVNVKGFNSNNIEITRPSYNVLKEKGFVNE